MFYWSLDGWNKMLQEKISLLILTKIYKTVKLRRYYVIILSFHKLRILY
jgi:hypothetical protein